MARFRPICKPLFLCYNSPKGGGIMAKVYFHVDVNSAFLSWSALKLLRSGQTLDLRTVPSAVGGDEEKPPGKASLPPGSSARSSSSHRRILISMCRTARP